MFYIYRLCVSDEDYNQYECIQEYINNKLREELKCNLPHHIHNEVDTGKKICANLSEFQGKTLVSVNDPKSER